MSAVISHKLDLAILLIDTTSGYMVREMEVTFTFDKSYMPKPAYRGSGTYILTNTGRDNMLMQVKAKNYEPTSVEINYEELDPTFPLKAVFLIPSENALNYGEYATLRGKIPNLKSVSLIQKDRGLAHIDTYDKRRRILSVFEKGNRLNMEGSPFAIVNEAEGSFERIDVVKQIAGNKIEIKNQLLGEPTRNAPVCRILFGYVEPDGTYLIRVRDDRSDLRGLVRFEVEGEEIRFEEVNFHQSENEPKKGGSEWDS